MSTSDVWEFAKLEHADTAIVLVRTSVCLVTFLADATVLVDVARLDNARIKARNGTIELRLEYAELGAIVPPVLAAGYYIVMRDA